MRQKSDKKKILEGRCLGEGSDYVGFIKANEGKSIGTAVEIYDPIADRTVDVLSTNEKNFFWILRFRDDVSEIREQMIMNPDIVREICKENDFRVPIKCLSTDFLVTYTDGSMTAYSVKDNRDIFDLNKVDDRKRAARERLLIRQYIEKEYWSRHGVEFRIVFGQELNKILSYNIQTCMSFYNGRYLSDEESVLKYLVAHKMIRIEMDKEPIKFAVLVQDAGIKEEIKRWYTGGGQLCRTESESRLT